MTGDQRRGKVLKRRTFLTPDTEGNQDLPRLFAHTHRHETKAAFPGTLVIGTHFVLLGKPAEGRDDRRRLFVLQSAAINRSELVGGGLPHTRNDPSVGEAEGSADLTAVPERIIHTDDRLNVTEAAEQADYRSHFIGQLLRISHVQLTTTAFFVDGTARLFFQHAHLLLANFNAHKRRSWAIRSKVGANCVRPHNWANFLVFFRANTVRPYGFCSYFRVRQTTLSTVVPLGREST